MKFCSFVLAALLSACAAAPSPKGKCNFNVEFYSNNDCKTKLDPSKSSVVKGGLDNWNNKLQNSNFICASSYGD